MISQKPNNFHWPEETPPSPHQEQTAPAASSWQGWSLGLRILGVVVALGAGFGQFFPSPLPLSVYFLVPILVGVLSAGLFRSWWVMLVVPVAFSIGVMLSLIVQGQKIDLSSLEGWAMVLVFGVVPIVIGAAIGTRIGKWIEQRLHH